MAETSDVVTVENSFMEGWMTRSNNKSIGNKSEISKTSSNNPEKIYEKLNNEIRQVTENDKDLTCNNSSSNSKLTEQLNDQFLDSKYWKYDRSKCSSNGSSNINSNIKKETIKEKFEQIKKRQEKIKNPKINHKFVFNEKFRNVQEKNSKIKNYTIINEKKTDDLTIGSKSKNQKSMLNKNGKSNIEELKKNLKAKDIYSNDKPEKFNTKCKQKNKNLIKKNANNINTNTNNTNTQINNSKAIKNNNKEIKCSEEFLTDNELSDVDNENENDDKCLNSVNDKLEELNVKENINKVNSIDIHLNNFRYINNKNNNYNKNNNNNNSNSQKFISNNINDYNDYMGNDTSYNQLANNFDKLKCNTEPDELLKNQISSSNIITPLKINQSFFPQSYRQQMNNFINNNIFTSVHKSSFLSTNYSSNNKQKLDEDYYDYRDSELEDDKLDKNNNSLFKNDLYQSANTENFRKILITCNKNKMIKSERKDNSYLDKEGHPKTRNVYGNLSKANTFANYKINQESINNSFLLANLRRQTHLNDNFEQMNNSLPLSHNNEKSSRTSDSEGQIKTPISYNNSINNINNNNRSYSGSNGTNSNNNSMANCNLNNTMNNINSINNNQPNKPYLGINLSELKNMNSKPYYSILVKNILTENFKNNTDNSCNSNNNVKRGEKKQINLEAIAKGLDNTTTIMIRNIPIKYTDELILESLEEFKGKFNCLYMPYDFAKNGNRGYAFINFVDPLHILYFYEKFHGKSWEYFDSMKICELNIAYFQGITEIQRHAKNYRGPKIPRFYKGCEQKQTYIIPKKYFGILLSRFPKMEFTDLPNKNAYLVKSLESN